MWHQSSVTRVSTDLMKQLNVSLKHRVNLLNRRHFTFMSYRIQVLLQLAATTNTTTVHAINPSDQLYCDSS